MKIIVRGPLLSKSGYGEHSRQVFKWALARGHDVRCQILNWGVTPWYLDKDDLGGLVGDIMQRSATFEEKPDLSLQIQLPNEWDPSLAIRNIGITAGVESNKCSDEWKQDCKKMDMVIVPSQFSRSAFVNDKELENKIVVVPEAYSTAIDESLDPLPLEEINTKFNFLLFGQITSQNSDSDRKNLFSSIKWFCDEFKGNKDVGLIIKTNLGTNCVFHRKALRDMMKNYISSIRPSAFPKVFLLNGDMNEKEVASLLVSKKVNCMISFTRGEGYGLPLVDAAASGLPIIATNWSGHPEFLSQGNFGKVEYDLVQVPKDRCDGKIFIEGSMWAQPREENARKRMRKIVDSYNTPKEWAFDLQKKVREKFSIERILSMYDEVIVQK